MLSDDELRNRLSRAETDTVERTQSTNNTTKFGEAICAFSNDLLDRREIGVLFIGATDDGNCANITVDEKIVQRILAFRRNGEILPPPSLTARIHTLDGCEMVIVEVLPSEMPPVRYDGRICIRAGARRDYATAEEERQLVEKRRRANISFDQRGIPEATINDLDLLRFREEYLRAAVHPDVIEENGRTVEEQLRALGLLDSNNLPTAVGLLICGKNPCAFLPGAYVQFVRYPGTVIGDLVQDQKEISGPLSQVFSQLDELIAANNRRRADLSGPKQTDHPDYPQIAIQEMVRNAIIHRNYEATTSPVMFTWFDDRVEITSPGGPFGAITVESFGQAGLSEARNPALATAAKAMNYVQRFGSGIPRARAAMEANGNPPIEFEVNNAFVHVRLRAAP
ncbi:ATP-binding protein [Roseiterribacter gracilis]|uniref:Schlafen AlbA-2 domain-containing protein n=1 Tax=Roseiterribacter gracilis TaxID=2812848 RepID=A0A8S8XBW0_9PROT|nr:hypothetical protein TMPK1_31800 [Rhodospirillales bacterium TMPK1]